MRMHRATTALSCQNARNAEGTFKGGLIKGVSIILADRAKNGRLSQKPR